MKGARISQPPTICLGHTSTQLKQLSQRETKCQANIVAQLLTARVSTQAAEQVISMRQALFCTRIDFSSVFHLTCHQHQNFPLRAKAPDQARKHSRSDFTLSNKLSKSLMQLDGIGLLLGSVRRLQTFLELLSTV